MPVSSKPLNGGDSRKRRRMCQITATGGGEFSLETVTKKPRFKGEDGNTYRELLFNGKSMTYRTKYPYPYGTHKLVKGGRVDDLRVVYMRSKEGESMYNELKRLVKVYPDIKVTYFKSVGLVKYNAIMPDFGETLQSMLKSEKASFLDKLKAIILTFEAMKGIHEKNLVHGDAKTDNVAISNGKARFFDFGMAVCMGKSFEDDPSYRSCYYFDSQRFGKKGCSEKTDVFSMMYSLLLDLKELNRFNLLKESGNKEKTRRNLNGVLTVDMAILFFKMLIKAELRSECFEETVKNMNEDHQYFQKFWGFVGEYFDLNDDCELTKLLEVKGGMKVVVDHEKFFRKITSGIIKEHVLNKDSRYRCWLLGLPAKIKSFVKLCNRINQLPIQHLHDAFLRICCNQEIDESVLFACIDERVGWLKKYNNLVSGRGSEEIDDEVVLLIGENINFFRKLNNVVFENHVLRKGDYHELILDISKCVEAKNYIYWAGWCNEGFLPKMDCLFKQGGLFDKKTSVCTSVGKGFFREKRSLIDREELERIIGSDVYLRQDLVGDEALSGDAGVTNGVIECNPWPASADVPVYDKMGSQRPGKEKAANMCL